MLVTDVIFAANGMTVTFDDNSVANVVYVVRNGILQLEGFTSTQQTAFQTFIANKDDSTQIDPRFASSGGGFPTADFSANAAPFTLSADMTCEGDDVTTLFEFPEFEIPLNTRILFFTWRIVEFPAANTKCVIQDTDGGVYINAQIDHIGTPDYIIEEGQNITDDTYGLQIETRDGNGDLAALPDGETIRIRLVAWGYTITQPSAS